MRIIINFIYFLYKPSKEDVIKWTFYEKLNAILLLLCLNFIFLLAINLIKLPLLKYSIMMPLTDNFAPIKNMYKLFLYSVAIGPLIEEIAFRLWIRYNKIGISLSIVALIFMVFGKLHLYKSAESSRIILLVLIEVCAFVISYLILKHFDSLLIKFWNKHTKTFIIISAIVFGYMHITNFRITKDIIIFSPLILAPLIFGGLILGYIRARLGFTYSLAFHVLNNLIPTLAIVFLK